MNFLRRLGKRIRRILPSKKRQDRHHGMNMPLLDQDSEHDEEQECCYAQEVKILEDQKEYPPSLSSKRGQDRPSKTIKEKVNFRPSKRRQDRHEGMNMPLLNQDSEHDEEQECCYAEEVKILKDQREYPPTLRKDDRECPPLSGSSRTQKGRHGGMNMPLLIPDIGDDEGSQWCGRKVEFQKDKREFVSASPRKDHRAPSPPSRLRTSRKEDRNGEWTTKGQARMEEKRKAPNFTRIVKKLLKGVACHKESETERKFREMRSGEWEAEDQVQVEIKPEAPDLTMIVSDELLKDVAREKENETERKDSEMSVGEWQIEDRDDVEKKPEVPDFTMMLSEELLKDVAYQKENETERKDSEMSVGEWEAEEQVQVETKPKAPDLTRIVLKELLKDVACHKENETEKKDSEMRVGEWEAEDQTNVETKPKAPDLTRIVSERRKESLYSFGMLKDVASYKDTETERKDSEMIVGEWDSGDQAHVETKPKAPDFTGIVSEKRKESLYPSGMLKDVACYKEDETEKEGTETQEGEWINKEKALVGTKPKSSDFAKITSERIKEALYPFIYEPILKDFACNEEIGIERGDSEMRERSTSPLRESDSTKFVEEFFATSTGSFGVKCQVKGDTEIKKNLEESIDSLNIERLFQIDPEMKGRDTSLGESDFTGELFARSTGSVGIKSQVKEDTGIKKSLEGSIDSLNIERLFQIDPEMKGRDTSPVGVRDSKKFTEALLPKSADSVGIESQMKGGTEIMKSLEESTDSLGLGRLFQEDPEIKESLGESTESFGLEKLFQEDPEIKESRGKSTESFGIERLFQEDPEFMESREESTASSESVGSGEDQEDPDIKESDTHVREQDSIGVTEESVAKSKPENQDSGEFWKNCGNLKEVRILTKGQGHKMKVKEDKRTGRKVIVKGIVGNRKDALREINAMMRLNDSSLFLKLLNYSHRSSFWADRQKLHLFIDYFDCDPLSIYPCKFFTNEVLQRIFSQVGQALKYMHEKRIIHRRIRPENILVNKELDVKICNFTRALFGPTAIESCHSFTENRMNAPEYINAKDRSDTTYSYEIDYYSTGATLYYLKFGNAPKFKKTGQRKLFSKSEASGQQEWEVKFPKPLDPDLADLIKALLHHVPELRLGERGFLRHPFFGEMQLTSDGDVCIDEKEIFRCEEVNFFGTLHCGRFGDINLMRRRGTEDLYVDKVKNMDLVAASGVDLMIEANAMKICSDREPFLKFYFFTYMAEKKLHHIFMEHFEGWALIRFRRIFIHMRSLQKIARQVCEGLQFIHAQGIIHRDVTGENILFNNRLEIKLIDFDNATNGPEAVGAVGTQGYQSPEVCMHWYHKDAPTYSYPADFFSFGATIYRLCYSYYVGELARVGKVLRKSPKKKKDRDRKHGFVCYPYTLEEPLMSFLKELLIRNPSQRLQDHNVMDHAFLQLEKPNDEPITRDLQEISYSRRYYP